MGLKCNLKSVTFVFGIVRGEGGIKVYSRPTRNKIGSSPGSVACGVSLLRFSVGHHEGCLVTFQSQLLFGHLCALFL